MGSVHGHFATCLCFVGSSFSPGASRCPRLHRLGQARAAIPLAACSSTSDGALCGTVTIPIPDRTGVFPGQVFGCTSKCCRRQVCRRYQAALRLLLNRAHGHHHFCIRPWRTGSEFCGVAAHDRSLTYEVSHLLYRGTCFAEGWHAADGWHSRACHHQPDHWLGTSAWVACNSRHASVWRVCKRISHSHNGNERASLDNSISFVALGVAFAGIFSRVQPMVFGDSDAARLPHSPALLPVFAHLAMVLTLGIYMPTALADWYRAAARLIG